ncbi:hypothetical protein Lfu02_22970 [Longispora fulva]|uniref:Uncharacterized protein n=1 Tax=Longispora fulva TaxID=619741 RepID=A0A8J7GXK5_9ACTN|nr:hypothetical protein [Longispora fulva]MBG6139693.1 hypothetical protein [Longispora fulva]GIG57925.1 hypothetical protein Lfu02_22970 [Longispora fulva]
MNHPTDSFGNARGTVEDHPPQFRGPLRQGQVPQPGPPESDRTLGLRDELAQQNLLRNGADLPPLVEPVYAEPMFDPELHFGTDALGDHPLLRGLLQELPPRGGKPPSVEWLDRWFEATRSILDLLYSQGSYKIGT